MAYEILLQDNSIYHDYIYHHKRFADFMTNLYVNEEEVEIWFVCR